MKKVIAWFRKLFGYLGEIWETFRRSNAGSSIILALNDHALQSEALNLVTTLADSSLSAKEKEESFNAAFNTYCKANNLTIHASVVNTLRELAYAAYQLRLEKASQ